MMTTGEFTSAPDLRPPEFPICADEDQRSQKERTMLNFTIHQLGKTVLFRCSGRLVSADAERLRDAVLAHPQSRIVVLDLEEIANIDAAGVGILVSLREWAQRSGIQIKLMNLIPRVAHVLELTKLKAVFEVCSAPEMLELLCRAIDQTKPAATKDLAVNGNLIKEAAVSNGRKGSNTEF